MRVLSGTSHPERQNSRSMSLGTVNTALDDRCEVRDHHSGVISALVTFTLSRRRALRNRLTGPSQWRRLLCLGIILTDFAIIGLAASMFEISLIAYEPGTAPVMGGAALAIIIFRIARPAVPFDWLVIGAVFMGVGILLVVDPFMSSHIMFTIFSILLTFLSLALIWIGATTSPEEARVWVTAGGGAALLCTIASVVAHIANSNPQPDTVASVVLLLTGMSFLGLALSLRPKG